MTSRRTPAPAAGAKTRKPGVAPKPASGMTTRKAIVLGLLAFALAMIVVLPASWVGGALPPGVRCASWSGSVWRGQCRDLTVRQGGRTVMELSTLRWRLKPLSLLRLTMAADFRSEWPQGEASGSIEIRPGGTIRLRETAAKSVLDQRFFGALPRGWSGRADVRGLEFDWRPGRLDRLGGEFLISDLADARGLAMGSYRIDMPVSSTPPFAGQLTDTAGPVQVDAKLELAADRSWNLEGRMRQRNAGDVRLSRQLDVLAPADLTGWRRLSAAGSFN